MDEFIRTPSSSAVDRIIFKIGSSNNESPTRLQCLKYGIKKISNIDHVFQYICRYNYIEFTIDVQIFGICTDKFHFVSATRLDVIEVGLAKVNPYHSARMVL